MNKEIIIKILTIIFYFTMIVVFFIFIGSENNKNEENEKEIIINKKLINAVFFKDHINNIRVSILTKEFEDSKRENYELSMIDFKNNKLKTVKIIEK